MSWEKKDMWPSIFIVQESSSTPFSLPVGMHGKEVCPVQRNRWCEVRPSSTAGPAGQAVPTPAGPLSGVFRFIFNWRAQSTR